METKKQVVLSAKPSSKTSKSPIVLVEIARSFAYKLNIGNYQSADFFCSRKQEVPIQEDDEASEAMFQWCKGQVEMEVSRYIEEHKPESEKIIDVGVPLDFPKKK